MSHKRCGSDRQKIVDRAQSRCSKKTMLLVRGCTMMEPWSYGHKLSPAGHQVGHLKSKEPHEDV